MCPELVQSYAMMETKIKSKNNEIQEPTRKAKLWMRMSSDFS